VIAPALRVIGKPIARVEGPDKVTGRARYSADISLTNLLWAKNVRSPHAHARIISIDTSRALRVPGVRKVITAADIPNKRIGRRLKDHPLLCDDVVRFIGDKVAVVAADDPEAAEEAALLVAVEYEELPAVFDPIAAMTPDAPLVHVDPRSYVGWPAEIPADAHNVCAYQVWDRGDIAAGFADADLVVEHTFRTQLSHQGYLEPHACVVAINNQGRVEIWPSNKVPFNLKDELAEIIERPEDDLLIHAVNVGGDFGSKGSPFDVPTAYYVARATGRPVKFVNSSAEDLTAQALRHPSVVTMKTGVMRDGRIAARETRVVFNTGAYGGYKPSANGMLGGAQRAAGCYTIPHFRTEAFCVYTNQVPGGYMRAPGSPQVLFAEETHMDLLARELGMDPIEFRERNLPAASPIGEERLAQSVLRAAADAIDWDAPKPKSGGRIGRGISLVMRNTGTGEGSSALTLNLDGTITAVTAMPDNGTGGLTVVAQVAAEAFGVPVEKVRLVWGDTDSLPVDVGSGASRMTNVAGHAVLTAAEKLKEQLAPLAATMLGSERAEWADGGWQSPDGRRVGLEELALEMIEAGDPRAHAQVTISTPRSEIVGYCAQAAEVEVDVETGQVTLRNVSSAQDVGQIVNAIGHQGQIEGALSQGLGYALLEEMGLDQGRITTPNLGDYKLPSIADLPPLETRNLASHGPGPFEAKAIGEIPLMGTGATIANAVADAIGVPFFELPITAERVLAALEATRGATR
jgi:CO/xanthine dehydrogenase Mo-binding subunit